MDKVIKVINLLKIAIIFAFGLFSTAGYSLSSDWAISEKSKVRLISPMTSSNTNQLILALEYELEEEWKTYWKSPGDGGFAQDLLWEKSTNINNIEIEWPKPKSFEILDLDTIGYEDEVIFPLVVNIKDNSKITKLGWEIKGARSIKNDLQIKEKFNFKRAAKDLLITSQLRTSMITSKKIKAVNYNIDTYKKKIYIYGIAQDEDERKEVINEAKQILDVEDVISSILLIEDLRVVKK